MNDSTTSFSRSNAVGLRGAVNNAVNNTLITDIHTHLYATDFGDLLLWGIDELLTYHYLVAEFFRLSDMPYDQFWALSKSQQADVIWQTLFIENSPLSEACRGVITVLDSLGLDVSSRNLKDYRAWFAAQKTGAHVDRVFEVARLKCAVMTNDPFDPLEQPVWAGDYQTDERFYGVLRIDPLLNAWGSSCTMLKEKGYDVESTLNDKTKSEIRRFLTDWVKRFKALYMAVSLPPDFMMPDASPRGIIIEECILPVAREFNIPFAMMIGVTRQINPQLRLAGDSVAPCRLEPVEYLCAKYPHNKFMVTTLSREDQHTLCVTARKFRNLLIFGCWWFLNNPSIIQEMTEMRLEMLGPSIIPQHSDARVLDQVIYKWKHSREIIAKVLRHKYADLVEGGWTISEAEIKRDAEQLLGGNFWRFIDLSL
tara:strand:- start:1409 stop:2680 length:1272 start_codon:yes stop_codon:yes gene_type:complete